LRLITNNQTLPFSVNFTNPVNGKPVGYSITAETIDGLDFYHVVSTSNNTTIDVWCYKLSVTSFLDKTLTSPRQIDLQGSNNPWLAIDGNGEAEDVEDQGGEDGQYIWSPVDLKPTALLMSDLI
jgi:hypothetical protein